MVRVLSQDLVAPRLAKVGGSERGREQAGLNGASAYVRIFMNKMSPVVCMYDAAVVLLLAL